MKASRFYYSFLIIPLLTALAACSKASGNSSTDLSYRVSSVTTSAGDFLTCEYDSKGNPVKAALFNSSNEPQVYRTWTYDSKGNKLSNAYYVGGTGSTIETLTGGTLFNYFLMTYDGDGNLLSTAYYEGGTDLTNGTQRNYYLYTYDDHGNKLSSAYYTDGTNITNGTQNEYYLYTYSVDGKLLLHSVRYIGGTDLTNGAQNDYVLYTYEHGKKTAEVSYYGGSGTNGGTQSGYKLYEYDSICGKVSLEAIYNNGTDITNGTLASDMRYVYGTNGNMTVRAMYDKGSLFFYNLYTYDSNNNMTSDVYCIGGSDYTNGDQYMYSLYTYDGNGNMLTESNYSEGTGPSGGTLDNQYTFTWEESPASDFNWWKEFRL